MIKFAQYFQLLWVDYFTQNFETKFFAVISKIILCPHDKCLMV